MLLQSSLSNAIRHAVSYNCCRRSPKSFLFRRKTANETYNLLKDCLCVHIFFKMTDVEDDSHPGRPTYCRLTIPANTETVCQNGA